MVVQQQTDIPLMKNKHAHTYMLFSWYNLLIFNFEIYISRTVNKIAKKKMTKKKKKKKSHVFFWSGSGFLVFTKPCSLLGTAMIQVVYWSIEVLAGIDQLTLENCNLHIYQSPDKRIYPLVAKIMLNSADVFVLRN